MLSFYNKCNTIFMTKKGDIMKNKKMKNWVKLLIGLLSILVLFVIALLIYASDPYEVQDEMYDQIELLDTSDITFYEDGDEISLTVSNPINNIIFIPGGLVEPESYEYLAYLLAQAGNNVTIYKPLLNLAILTPNKAIKFIDDDLNNIVIGHSLGGIVASGLASENEEINQVILLGSYAQYDCTEKDVLIISAEFDIAMDLEAKEEAEINLPSDYTEMLIEDGNHAQFGWYGPQDGDGEANITTLEQQTITFNYIIDFITD